jgi:hypothetical protein
LIWQARDHYLDATFGERRGVPRLAAKAACRLIICEEQDSSSVLANYAPCGK